MSAAVLVNAVSGLDDFDSALETGASAAAVAFAAACWAGTIDLLRVGQPPEAP